MSAGDRSSAAGSTMPMSGSHAFRHLAILSAGGNAPSAGPLPRRWRRSIHAPTCAASAARGRGREQRSFLSGVAAAMTALGAMALLLSVVSIYALLSFIVTRRTREIGIRVALGARRAHVLATVAGRTSALVGAGAVLGTILGVWLAGFQSVMLIRMPHAGFMTPAIVIGLLATSSLLASWVPTRRALSIRPAEALSSD